jgi:hypothetical protein
MMMKLFDIFSPILWGFYYLLICTGMFPRAAVAYTNSLICWAPQGLFAATRPKFAVVEPHVMQSAQLPMFLSPHLV